MIPTPQRVSATTELDALLHHAAIAPLDDLGWLRVTGEDRVRWLNGMVTNSITALAPGQGNYNFILSAQGRIQGTVNAFAQSGSILLQTGRAELPALLPLLGRFIIMDDVELTDATGEWSGITAIGPQAASLLASLGLNAAGPEPTALVRTTWRSQEVTLIHAHSPLISRYELWAAPETTTALQAALSEAGTTSVTAEALEALRILEGTPRYNTDIRDRELPQETAQTRALHFAKGCYLGQEIVERIRSRGNVHRTFTGFRLTGALPVPGTPLEADGKAVGELTSVASLPLPGETLQIALGYIRREALDRAATLTYPGGQAIPTTLPFAVV